MGAEPIFHEGIALALLAASIDIDGTENGKRGTLIYKFCGAFLEKARKLKIWSVNQNLNSTVGSTPWEGLEVGWTKTGHGELLIIHALPI